MLGIGKHSDEGVSILGDFDNALPEGDVVLGSFFGLADVNIEGEDLVSLLGKVDGHGEAHIS